METFDAVIIGGGPAGSTCAWRLTEAGMRVAVLDRAMFPRDKVCAGWITPEVVKLLSLDTAHYRQSRIFQPITAFRTAFGSRNDETETRYGEPVSFGIRRYEFDHYLLQRCGATLRCGTGVSRLQRIGTDWLINGTIQTPMLIGAGGHFCPAARHLNPAKRTSIVATLEMELRLDDDQLARSDVQPDTPLLRFCEDLKGYGWCFRKGCFLNIGFGRQDPHDLPHKTDAFVEFLKASGVVAADVPLKMRGHAYLLADGTPRTLVDDGVLLVGDAAGLADAHSGEGIRPAVESGLLAASAIIDASGHYRRDRLVGYARSVRKRFHAGSVLRLLAEAIPNTVTRGAAERVMRTRWLTRRLVLDRWFLGRHRPPLEGSTA